jgi:hypothetical protein
VLSSLDTKIVTVDSIEFLDDERLLCTVSNSESCKYRISIYTLKYFYQLEMVWSGTGVGSCATMSPVYKERYVLVGSRDNAYMDLWDLQKRVLARQYDRKSNDQKDCIGMLTQRNQHDYVFAGNHSNPYPCC